MSNFNCEKCGAPNIDSDNGYISGCSHYPPESNGLYTITTKNPCGDETQSKRVFYHGWMLSLNEKIVRWEKLG